MRLYIVATSPWKTMDGTPGHCLPQNIFDQHYSEIWCFHYLIVLGFGDDTLYYVYLNVVF